MTDEHLRMSDAERDRAAAELGEHYAQGRLTVDEHAERLDRIWAARTRGELGPIFADLPAPAAAVSASAPRGSGAPTGPSPRRRFHGLPFPLAAVLAVLLVITVVTHLPLILVGVAVWFLLSRRHCSSSSRRPHWS